MWQFVVAAQLLLLVTLIIKIAKNYCGKREVPHILFNFMVFMELLQLKGINTCFPSKTVNGFSGLCHFTLSVSKMKRNHESFPFLYSITVQNILKKNNNQIYLGLKTLKRVTISWQTNLGLNPFFFDKKGGNISTCILFLKTPLLWFPVIWRCLCSNYCNVSDMINFDQTWKIHLSYICGFF